MYIRRLIAVFLNSVKDTAKVASDAFNEAGEIAETVGESITEKPQQ
jgi:hypothetical protein